jgi:hypothetical protein
MVFSYGVASGTIADGSTIIGATSGAVATATHMTATTTLTGSAQILLTKIASSTFQAGEKIYIQGQSSTTYYAYLSDAGTSTIAVAKCRTSTGVPDTTAVTIDGWTTGENNYIKIYTPVSSSEVGTSQRHNGTWDDNKYRIEYSDENVVTLNENYITVEGLQVHLSGTTNYLWYRI